MQDVEVVGGKNASLGEMIGNLSGLGVSVPGGFATTSEAYRDFLKANRLNDTIADTLNDLDVDDIPALTEAGKSIREAILASPLPDELNRQIESAWEEMSAGSGYRRCGAVISNSGRLT